MLQLDELKDKLETRETSLRAAQGEVERLTTSLDALEQEAASRAADLATAERDCADNAGALSEARQALAEREEELAVVTEQRGELLRSHQLQTDDSAALATATTHLGRLQASLLSAQQKETQTRHELALVTFQRDALDKEKDQLAQSVASLEKRIEDYNKDRIQYVLSQCRLLACSWLMGFAVYH